jgi:hypothetical protein
MYINYSDTTILNVSNVPDINVKSYLLPEGDIAEMYIVQDGVITKDLSNPNYRSFIRKTSVLPLVESILVEVGTGKVFDGDEKSQDRMMRAINIAAISGITETKWKLADNSVQTVTLEELKEALVLSGIEMSKIWLA